jgi:hypothetical protein
VADPDGPASATREITMTVRRLSATAAAILICVCALVLTTGGTASASGTSHKNYCGTGSVSNQCVDVNVDSSGGQVFGFANALSIGHITVYVEQCRGDLTVCGTISANHQDGVHYVETSKKPTAFGHVYRACASFTNGLVRILNVCSGWVTA